MRPQDIRISDYNYELPDERIAKYPLAQRDMSKLLVYRKGEIAETQFERLPDLLPDDAMLVFNNTRVIRARLLFHKDTGAAVEIFCLEPIDPCDYALAFRQTRQCVWKCLTGNLKKWKDGALRQVVRLADGGVTLVAERGAACDGGSHLITFSWDHPSCTFADILEAAGVLPVPPYLKRATEPSDLQTYQTVYAKIKGSVAAPTAGLHFTPATLATIDRKGIRREEITLHVGAGTFKPVRSETLGLHNMHAEHFSVARTTIEHLLHHRGTIIATGTTSVRTLESLYYIGKILADNPDSDELQIGQWTPYETGDGGFAFGDAMRLILDYLDRRRSDQLIAQTSLMIVPGYTFKAVRGIITNFHQPQSTLLLLISAFVGGDWKRIYDYALAHDFRFLSYGDSSLLL